MRILFLHRNFPAQFRHLATYLAQDKNNQVVFLTNRNDKYTQRTMETYAINSTTNAPPNPKAQLSFLISISIFRRQCKTGSDAEEVKTMNESPNFL